MYTVSHMKIGEHIFSHNGQLTLKKEHKKRVELWRPHYDKLPIAFNGILSLFQRHLPPFQLYDTRSVCYSVSLLCSIWRYSDSAK